jgi:hypothetical protein
MGGGTEKSSTGREGEDESDREWICGSSLLSSLSEARCFLARRNFLTGAGRDEPSLCGSASASEARVLDLDIISRLKALQTVFVCTSAQKFVDG